MFKLYISSVLCGDSVVITVGLGLGKETTWLGLGKDHCWDSKYLVFVATNTAENVLKSHQKCPDVTLQRRQKIFG